ncbi:serine/threonine protein kinase [Gordonia sp. PP30]|uniref:serine/threonine-protein kinase n=1 Tax=unclassified Gordonia (in: high G+C Gram-positive bacteria) TaxID=2657482 RepID=UPI001FFEBAEE|nr:MULTISPECIES: serine/threonine-protein kinase [unclassified Gordonia (in: high G+C Gram-positive bacteria)]UQE73418.1 serine/threonine protein kinase [Gordonia sp. PP30]
MTGPVPGGVFAGYDVLSLLGRGGMGTVFLVRNPHLDRREALKVLTVDAHGDFAARFAAEARTVASLDHPGIVTVYHHGITDGIPWFTMQFLAGNDLAGVGRLPLPEVREIVRQAGDALDYAHRRGVVHRDVKPANVQVGRTDAGAIDRVTVLDFGIARLAGATSLTAADSFVGTLTYSAPETVRGQRDVPAADQYSLACTAYELLTGRPPFAGLSTAALLSAQLNDTPPPISSLVPELAGLDPVFARALAKEPEQRYPSCAAFAAALTAGGEPASIRPPTRVAPVPLVPPPAAPSAPPPRGTRPFTAPAPPPPRPAPPAPARVPARTPRSRSSSTTIVLAVLAILLSVGVVAGALYLANSRSSGTPSPGPAPSTTTLTSTTTSTEEPASVWGLVVSPQGRVVRFKDYPSQDALLGAAANYGFNESWGYSTFSSGCAAVAHVTSGSSAYYTATAGTRSAASDAATARATSATGETSRIVSTLCVGDSF